VGGLHKVTMDRFFCAMATTESGRRVAEACHDAWIEGRGHDRGFAAGDVLRFADLIEPRPLEHHRVADPGHARLA
jgi:hypothetical protein